jgi:proteasome lid subunit RPN8/RPN11
MQIHIGASLLNRIMAEAAATPAQEICGLLFGQSGRIEAAERAANVADDPERTFEIEPAALFMAIRLERQGGPRLIGHYHSHPNGSTEPSPRDLAAAEPGRLWLILGDARPRLWLAEAGSFREMRLIVT